MRLFGVEKGGVPAVHLLSLLLAVIREGWWAIAVDKLPPWLDTVYVL